MDEIYGKSLEELEDDYWGDPPAGATSLVERVHRLRSLRLKDLSLEDLATMLGQREGPEWLVPLALDYLAGDPLAGDLYPGQLLTAVLHQVDYWKGFPRDHARLWSIRLDLVRRRAELDKALALPDWPVDVTVSG